MTVAIVNARLVTSRLLTGHSCLQLEQERDRAALDEYSRQQDLERQERERQRLEDSARYLEVSTLEGRRDD